MNRRSFISAACGGVVAAAVAPFAKPAGSTIIASSLAELKTISAAEGSVAIVEFGQSTYLGDMLPTYWKHSEGWSLSGPTIGLFVGHEEDDDDAADLLVVEA